MSPSWPLYPLRFTPVYQDYLWGGDRILRRFGRTAPPGIYAESWEISARPEGMSMVSNGPLSGRSLATLVEEMGAALLGSRVPGERFPLLFKIIDAHERLSVQVHPDEADAARYGGDAKTEMWYVLDADPGAAIFAGLKPGTTRKKFEEAVRQTRVDALLQRVPIKTGDAIFIPGGLVHALEPGSLIFEVQQNSNTTYRIYDWGRIGHDGRPRETHLAQALRVINWRLPSVERAAPRPESGAPGNRRQSLISCPCFFVDRIVLQDPESVEHDGGSFRALFCAEGGAQILHDGGVEPLPAGSSALAPAGLKKFVIDPTDRGTVVLMVGVP